MPLRDEPNVQTIREALLWASSFLRQSGSNDPRFEAELLLRYVLGMDRTAFLVSLKEPIPASSFGHLRKLCARRANREPLQYIVGQQEFFGRRFTVSPGVLIPRPETEILVEQVMLRSEHVWHKAADTRLRVADIGTGSGAIALTLAAERPNWEISTIDISPEAINIAQQNARQLNLATRVRFLRGDLASPLLAAGETVDILVSNPPYIPTEDLDGLDAEVRAFEPRLALDGGTDGLDCYRRLCAALPNLMNETALVAFEVGINQSRDVANLLSASGVVEQTAIVPDLAGIERVVLGWRKKNG